jgi:hypothetical protein
MVIFGPVLDSTGSWGLGVVEADDEKELRAFATDDPVVTTGTGTIEVGKMLGGLYGAAGPLRSWQIRASSASARLTPHGGRGMDSNDDPPKLAPERRRCARLRS